MGSVGNKETSSNVIDARNMFGQNNTQTNEESSAPYSRRNGWDYPGITKRINELENALNRARSTSRLSSILKALEAQDRVITTELETGDGDQTVLMGQRRRVRTLMRRIRNNG